MASNAADIGTGTTLTLATSSWDTALEIINITWGAITREAIPTTHLSTPVVTPEATPLFYFGTSTFIPGMLSDPGEVTFEVNFNPDIPPPIDGVDEVLTVTFLGPDDAAGATWVTTGHCTSFETSGTGVDTLMTASATFKISGNVVVTADS